MLLRSFGERPYTLCLFSCPTSEKLQQPQQQQDQQQQDQQQSEAGEDEPISPREAEQLLDALEDREQEAQKRRFRAVGRAQDKDW